MPVKRESPLAGTFGHIQDMKELLDRAVFIGGDGQIQKPPVYPDKTAAVHDTGTVRRIHRHTKESFGIHNWEKHRLTVITGDKEEISASFLLSS